MLARLASLGKRRPPVDPAARPMVRWWWFAGPIDRAALDAQLAWLAGNGFGGVEVAWVYPLSAEPGPTARWLSPEWTELAVHAKQQAEGLGLGCDFTFGSLWPFGGSIVPLEDSHQTFDGPSYRQLRGTWEDVHHTPTILTLDHLNRDALARYAEVMGAALAPALVGRTSALFCDSWEVHAGPDRLWSPRLWDRFRERFGYDLRPEVDEIEFDPALRYDYRTLIAEAVLDEFYRPFTAACHSLGAVSRVQCHGSPTDLLAAYAAVDIPETEVLLFPAPFSRIAASAAALAGRPVVTCETFTCLYGFPRVEFRREDVADLRLLADSAIAHGVNGVVWHGMPYNPPGGSNAFFATTHVGPDAAFAADLPAFNAYLAAACTQMRRGGPASNLAVYLPVEDNRMRDRLPSWQQTPGAHSYWEMRYEVVPEEAEPFAPLWVSSPFLADATWDGARLQVGAVRFAGLLLGSRWLDPAALDAVLRLAQQGLPVALTCRPQRPGRGDPGDFESRVDALLALPNVRPTLDDLPLVPIVTGAKLPPYWARVDGEALVLFFAHPGAWDVRFPMRLGQARELPPAKVPVTIHHAGRTHEQTLRFRPGRSVCVEVRGGRVVVISLD